MKIGIYGGSFNPVHNGHVKIVEHILENMDLDKLIVVPVGNPSHRDGLLSSIKRLEMVKVAFSEMKEVEVSDIEIREEGKSYTYETLMKFKKKYIGAKFYEIIGEDSADYLEKWVEYEKLIEEAKIIVLKRAGFDYKAPHKNIKVLTSPNFSYSSTKVRDAIEKDLDISSMVPKSVENIISENNFYKK